MAHTNSQKMSQTAYASVRRHTPLPEKYSSFARSFPSLIHACGLAQAVAFAKAKGQDRYLDDLATVLRSIGHADADSTNAFEKATREANVRTYVRLSRNALLAAGWLKRYVEAAEAK